MKQQTRRILDLLSKSSILPPVLVREARAEAMASVLGTASRPLSDAALSLVADAGLVLFAIDDLLDDPEISSRECDLRVAQWSAVARGSRCPEVAFDPVACAIAQLRERLSLVSDSGSIGLWSEAMQQMLLAMGEERRADDRHRDHGEAETVLRYFMRARETIGLKMIVSTAWVSMGAVSAGEALRALQRAERSFSIAVRVANDLQTCQRERLERRLTSVTLMGDEGIARLRKMRDRALAQGRRVLANGGLTQTMPGRFLERFSSALVTMYATRDFAESPPLRRRAEVVADPATASHLRRAPSIEHEQNTHAGARPAVAFRLRAPRSDTARQLVV